LESVAALFKFSALKKIAKALWKQCSTPFDKCRTIQTKNVFLPSKCKSILKKGQWSSSFESSSENKEKTLVSRYSNKAIINWARI
jgi:hypothetical protein